MRPTSSFLNRSGRQLFAASAVLALGLWASGCTTQSDGPADAGSDAAALTSIQRGAAVAKNSGCALCHSSPNAADGVLSGQTSPLPSTMAYAPNLTPDKNTGIGDWSDDDIIKAVRSGIDDEGAELCMAMPRFANLSDGDVHDLVAYLRSLPAVNRDIPESVCPPIKPQPVDGGTTD